MESLVQVLERGLGVALAHEWLWRIALALGLLVVGAWLARRLSRVLDRVMLRFGVEDILRNFLRNLAYATAMVVVFIAALDFAGVPTTSLLAVVGAAGLAIGLALKDSLSNIASGVMLIVLRPFRAGDSVMIAGHEGVVESVRIFQTWIITVDNREVILPNSQITAAPIVNFTGRGERRLDLAVPMAFGEDLPALRAALLALAAANPRVKASPAPEALVTALGEGTVAVQLRTWVAARDYNAAQSELLEAALADHGNRGRKSPLPMREVHVYHHDAPGTLPQASLEAIKPAL
jgi:small-conductance mechanosensitive channel